MKEYYTYAYLRKNKTPYYIGKGKKKKGKYYSRTTALHENVYVPPKERILILKEFELEFDAYKHEMYMIKVFGRKDNGTGILHNRSDGGEGHTNMSEYARKRSSETHKGKVLSEETKNKIRQTRLKRNIRVSEEQKRKYSILFSGEGNPNYGKKHSPETLKKISDATRGKNTKTRFYVNPNGEIIKVDNLREFCEENKLIYTSMISVYTEKKYSHKGYTKPNSSLIKTNHWIGRKHKLESKLKIKNARSKYLFDLISPSGKEYKNIRFIADFCKENNLNRECIRRVALGKTEHYRGWKATRKPIQIGMPS